MSQFGQQVSMLVNAGLEAGVTPQEIVLGLELTKLELAFRIMRSAEVAAAEDEKPALIVPGRSE